MSVSIAQRIAEALGDHRAGSSWMACCPAHEDSTPSLAISMAKDGTLLVHCHAGCSQSAVIAALKACGQWSDADATHATRGADRSATQRQDRADPEERRRTAHALQSWCETRPATGTVVETYLRSRGIAMPIPGALKMHPNLAHRRTKTSWPGMVALVTRGAANLPVGIHRTWLARDGVGKAPVAPNKMMLGPCRGGAVRLAPAREPLMVGEGIETCLAGMQATGHTAWAALSTSGMRALELPDGIRNVIILADGDPPGRAAAEACASRWTAEGRMVRIASAPDGLDFNDLLLAGRLPGRDT